MVCAYMGEDMGVVYAERFGNQIYNMYTARAGKLVFHVGLESRIYYFQLVKHPLAHAEDVQVMLLLKTNKGEV